MKINWFALWIGLALIGAGCQKRQSGDAPELRFGRDVCVRCRMIINEARFAAGYVDELGRSQGFDDIGEMLQEAASRPERIDSLFVADFENESRWIQANQAIYVHAPGFVTPMGSGWLAFSSRDNARSFAGGRKEARVFTFLTALQKPTVKESAPGRAAP